ncbi:MAG TPA: zinc-dependent metalloprotease [Fulvivirga sp.]|nr:zinc-dependent metalloprotease [Fulvivirga sp.]
MKLHIFAFIFYFLIGISHAQIPQSSIECSTPNLDSATAVNLPYYNNNQIIENYLQQNGYDELEYISFPSTQPLARTSSTFLEPNFLIPLNIFIYRNAANNVNSAITEAEARDFVCIVNEIFRDANTGIQFYTNRVEIEANNFFRRNVSTTLHVYDMWSRKRYIPDNSKGINVHFIRNNSEPEDGFGKASVPYYPTPPYGDYSLYVRTHVNPNGTQLSPENISGTFAHELGHTLGLLHTHHPGRLLSLAFNEENATISNGCYQESVSRTRENKWYQGCPSTSGLKKCAINGDFLCDTDADPNQGGRGDGNCNYNYPSSGDFRTDNWGALWTPPTHNVMSYTTNNCRDEFSRSQIGIMWMQMPNLKNFINYQAPVISGTSNPICYGTSKTFTLSDFPSDAQITWEVTPSSLVNNPSGNGTSASLSTSNFASSGQANLTFTISGPNNCYIARVKKTIWVGKPSYPRTIPSGVPAIQAQRGSNVTIRVVDFLGGNMNSLIWSTNHPNDVNLNSTSGSLCVVEVLNNGTHNIYVNGSGSCGNASNLVPIVVSSDGGDCGVYPNPPCFPMIVYPNPSSSYFEVSLDLTQEEYSKGYEVKLYSSNQKNLIFQTNSTEPILRIQSSDIKKGIYILQLTTVKQVITDRVFIE